MAFSMSGAESGKVALLANLYKRRETSNRTATNEIMAQIGPRQLHVLFAFDLRPYRYESGLNMVDVFEITMMRRAFLKSLCLAVVVAAAAGFVHGTFSKVGEQYGWPLVQSTIVAGYFERSKEGDRLQREPPADFYPF